MTKKWCFFIIIISCFWQSTNHLFAQTYLKVYTNPDENFNQKIALFENGDILIGDSSIEPLKSGSETGIIQLTRLDNCGLIIWSFNYEIADGYVEFKDFAINDEDEIFLYGSFYKGLSEFIFLTKVDGQTGVNQDFQIFNTGTVDHFSYSIDVQADKIMVYGLRLGFQTQKEGFIVVFNKNFVYQWGKVFSPFESSGEAIFTNDGGIMAWSDKFLYKLDDKGEIEWASQLDAVTNLQIISGPLADATGFVFEVNSGNNSFFLKVDLKGQLVWQTDLFSASKIGGTMSIANVNLLATYIQENGNLGELCQVEVNPNGQLLYQRRLDLSQSLFSGNLYQVIHQNQITIAANDNPFNTTPTDFKDFILQFPLNAPPSECFLWNNFEANFPNNTFARLSDVVIEITDFEPTLERIVEADTLTFNPALIEYCDNDIAIENRERDTTLTCESDFWEINLPTNDFFWTDGTEEIARQLEVPGVYYARNRSCINPIQLSFELNKENCGCLTYLPNVFSPNNDGINDQLALFSNCTLDKLEMTIFNRWGERVFYSQQLNHFWDGIYQNQEAPAEVYIAIIKYNWIDFDGNMQEDVLYQDVSLLR